MRPNCMTSARSESPTGFLKKPAGLTEDEFEIIKSHCAVGSNIIRDESEADAEADLLKEHAKLGVRIFDDCNSPIMRMAALVAETHHEKWDGSGYPRGLAGKEIPLEGRITAVADVFDALSSKRPYKECIPLDQCFETIRRGRGTISIRKSSRLFSRAGPPSWRSTVATVTGRRTAKETAGAEEQLCPVTAGTSDRSSS